MSCAGFYPLKRNIKNLGIYTLWVRVADTPYIPGVFGPKQDWALYKIYHNVGHAKNAILLRKKEKAYKAGETVVCITNEATTGAVYVGKVKDFES